MDECKASENESDNEIFDSEHSKLLSAVRQLDGKQRVKPPSRREISREISEFNWGKHQTKNESIGIHELTKSLQKRASHVEIGEKLKSLKRKAKPLQRPLEKFEAEKIKRTVGFAHVKQQLNRWNAIVDRNRVAENLTFPLIPKGSISVDTTRDFVKRFESQSELEAKISEILNKSKVVKEEKEAEEEEFPLSLEEIIGRRKEMAKLRAQQSYREAKAHRQKKIKSKSYHRTLRHQRIKQQLKDFENLQKTDPEAALKQLEQIERARAEERMTLRHRNTGKWARSRAVRAKYDDQTRQELAEQLAISRDLTKKVQLEESSSDEAVEENVNVNDSATSDNPWVNGKTESEVASFVRGYRSYWEQKNVSKLPQGRSADPKRKQSEPHDRESGRSETEAHVSNERDSADPGVASEVGRMSETNESEHLEHGSKSSPTIRGFCEKSKRRKQPSNKTKKKQKCYIQECTKPVTSSPEFTGTNTHWQVTTIRTGSLGTSETVAAGDTRESRSTGGTPADENVDDLFQKMEQKMRASVRERIVKCRQELANDEIEINVTGNGISDETSVSLETRKQGRHPDIDEALSEGCVRHMEQPDVQKMQKISVMLPKEQKINEHKSDIDPKKFIAVKAKPLDSELPDVTEMEEAIDDDNDGGVRQLTITEAFADDDVVEQFRKEKEETVKKSQPEDIDLSLPGWGSWGGKGVLSGVPKKKKKRFLIKFPKPPPRKDANKGDVIINEEKDVKIKEHQVSELPFPFTTVRDFEASVRAPIGTTWVTQSAHSKLTAPKYRTKLGKIIKPMDENLLVKKKPTI